MFNHVKSAQQGIVWTQRHIETYTQPHTNSTNCSKLGKDLTYTARKRWIAVLFVYELLAF